MGLRDSLPFKNSSGYELWLLLVDHERHEWSVFKLEENLGSYIRAERKQHIELFFFAKEWDAIDWVTHAPVLAKYEHGEFPMGAPTEARNYGAACPKCEDYVMTPDLHLCKDGKPYVLFRVEDPESLVLLEPDKIATIVWVPHRDRENDTVKITLKDGDQGAFEVHHESATALLRCLRTKKL